MNCSAKDVEMASDKVEEVTDAYEHAIFAWFPRCRYVIGKGTGIMCVLSHLSEWLSDAVLARLAALPLPAAAAMTASGGEKFD